MSGSPKCNGLCELGQSLVFQCKFVEVKGQNDKLSTKQKFWLDFLRAIGCAVEVCRVHSKYSVGFKNTR